MNPAIAVNALLDLGILLGLFAVISIPFWIDRDREVTPRPAVDALPESTELFAVELAA
jgi:hypothetical protein